MMRNNMTLRRIKGVTRTIRLTIIDAAGEPVDLTQAVSVKVVVSKDGFGPNANISPNYTIGGASNNIITFVWYADQQNASGAGRYTITVFAYYNGRNVAKYNWHGPDGIELVEYAIEESGTLPDNMNESANVDLTGTFSMNGPGPSAYDEWLSSPESDGWPKTVSGFLTYLKEPATEAAEMLGQVVSEKMAEVDEKMVSVQERADEDHTRAEGDHTTAAGDNTRAAEDHSRAAEDHTTAGTDHQQAVADSERAASDHQRAEVDHGIAAEEHATAGSDHQRAEQDHTTAAGDHTRAEQDHSAATEDHTTAGQDHQRAEQDHTTATSDHTTAANDHQRAENDHARAEQDHTESATATGAANVAAQTATEAAEAADAARESIEGELAGKTDKPSSASEGNLAKFDANRNPVDSTYKAGSPILSFSLVGEGNTYVSKQINGLQPGHRYRVYLDNWDTSEVTSGDNYTRFYVACTSEGADLYLVREHMPCAQLPYYDLIVPEDVDSVTIGLRANTGSTVNIHIEDITAMYAELEEQRQKDLDAGLPVTLRFNDMMPILERFQDNHYIYAANAELNTAPSIVSQVNNYGVLNFKIPLIGGEKITLRQFGSINNSGSVFVDENNIVVSCITRPEVQDYTTYAPVSARYLFYSFTPVMRETGFVTIQRNNIYRLKDLEQRLKMAREVTGEEVKLMRSSDDFRAIATLYSKSQYKTGDSSSIGLSINEVVTSKNNSYYNYLIPVEGWKTIGFRQYKSSAGYGSAFLDENLNVIAGILNTTDNSDKTASVPQNAKWFFYSCSYENIDYITFYPDKTFPHH